MAFFFRRRLISVLTVASPQDWAGPTVCTISSAVIGPWVQRASMTWLSAAEIFDILHPWFEGTVTIVK